MARLRSFMVCTLVAVAVPAFGACSSDDGKTVDVVATDFTLTPSESSVAAGEVTFKVENNGEFAHEVVVVKADDASELSTDADGVVSEDGLPDGALIGEVEDVEPDSTKSFEVTLEAGEYVLLCNRVDGETVHFKEGMHVGFTVTP